MNIYFIKILDNLYILYNYITQINLGISEIDAPQNLKIL